MRPLRALVIYMAVVFLGGALLAPWLCWLAQTGVASFPMLADVPFHRFVHRSLLLLALAGLWPLLRGLGARSPGDLGLVAPTGQGRKMFYGFLLGFISLAALAALVLAGGARVLEEDLLLSKVTGKLLAAALAAVVVGVLEEILFRGGVFGGLRRVFAWPTALGISSVIYALVHFFAPARLAGDVTWASGLALLPQMWRGFADWQALLPGFLNLTLTGVLLGLAYQRTGNLYYSMGLHTGWVFWLKSYRALTAQNPGANLWLWGSSRLIDGWLALVILSLTVAVFLRLRLAEQTTRMR